MGLQAWRVTAYRQQGCCLAWQKNEANFKQPSREGQYSNYLRYIIY